VKKQFGVVSAIAECQDCDWRTEAYKNAQATAAIHAKSKGHKVIVETTMGGYYNGRSNAKQVQAGTTNKEKD